MANTPRRGTGSVLTRALEAASDKLARRATQEDVARMAGVQQPSVALWATGSPRLKQAVAFCEKTGVCVEWLYTNRGPKRPIPADPIAARIWDLWPSLTDITKGRLVQIAEDAASDRGSDVSFRHRA